MIAKRKHFVIPRKKQDNGKVVVKELPEVCEVPVEKILVKMLARIFEEGRGGEMYHEPA